MTLDSFVDQICDFEHTSLIEKILYIPSDYVYSEYIGIYSSVFFFSLVMTRWSILSRQLTVQCFGKIAFLARSP